MRRIRLIALVGTAIVILPASALASGAHSGAHHKHHKKPAKKPAAVENGTYNATFSNKEKFNITLTGAKVSLPTSPRVLCNGPAIFEIPVGSFVAPAALSAAGSITEQAPISAASVPGEPPLTGESTFSVTFTKKGTASGYLEESLAGTVGDAPISCTSGKVPFTAKLG